MSEPHPSQHPSASHPARAEQRPSQPDRVRVSADDALRPLVDTSLDESIAWHVVEGAPDAIVMADQDGRILLANRQSELMFGYDRVELLGQPVEMLIPERLVGVHSAHRLRYRAEPSARPMGSGVTLFARRKGGEEFPVEVSLSPLRTERGALVVASVRDITERIAREAEFARVMAALDATRDGVFVFHADSLRFTYVNQGAEHLTGYGRDRLATMTPLHFAPEFDAISFRSRLAALTDHSRADTFTTTVRRRDGHDIPVEVVMQMPLPDLVVAVVRDNTERLTYLERLQASEARVRQLVTSVPAWIWSLDADGVITATEGTLPGLRSLTDSAIGQPMRKVFADNQLALDIVERALSGRTFTEVVEIGSRAYQVSYNATLDEDGSLVSTVGIAFDISERRRAEEEMRRNREALQLTAERERIARDLHDTVIQRLFATGMSLEAMAASLAEPAAGRVHRAVTDLDDTIREIRGTIFRLDSGSRNVDESLRARVLDIVADASRALGFEPHVLFAGAVDTLVSPECGEHAVAVLREALSNCTRHAKAQRIDVQLVASPGELLLTVEDDGVGVPAVRNGRGNGLANIVARAEGLGGSAEVRSIEPHGTLLEWRVPLPDDV
jgi:PAS domain S-box-containing protein